MFVQVITAKVNDEAGVEAALKRWESELKRGATGWLGATSGVTKDGTHVAIVRFDSEENARANERRPEQDAWAKEFTQNFDGEPSFFDSTEVEPFGKGGSDDAGFVQVITGTAKNKTRLQELDRKFGELMPRPDVIGGINAWNGDRFVSVVYFTNEAEARENEAKPMEGDGKALMEELMSLMQDVTYYDLSNPQLRSA